MSEKEIPQLPLKDFIKKTLTDIIFSVTEAQEETIHTEARIAPAITGTASHDVLRADNKRLISMVEFDVVLTITQDKKKQNIIGVVAGNLGWGRKSEDGLSHKNFSRVKFSVPLALSRGDAKEKILKSIKDKSEQNTTQIDNNI